MREPAREHRWKTCATACATNRLAARRISGASSLSMTHSRAGPRRPRYVLSSRRPGADECEVIFACPLWLDTLRSLSNIAASEAPRSPDPLDFLEKQLDEKSTWLVRRYRRELRWDRRTYEEQEELREILRVTTRGIQFACVKLIVRRLNELAIHFRKNKPSIDNLRLQLVIVRRPVRL